MEYKEAYEEYKAEHPEEMVRLNELKAKSRGIEKDLERRRRAKVQKIAEMRRMLYGEEYSE